MSAMDRNLQGSDVYRVGILALPGFALMSYACSVEPLRAANLLAGRTLYEVTHFGAASVPSSGAAVVETALPVGSKADLDLLLVVAGGDPFAYREPVMLDWLAAMARRGVRIGGVSGGAVVLARAGLLDGYRATVHWEHAAALSEAHPDLWIEKRLYLIDRNRLTCGGGTAPLDLMHALIVEHHGHGFARLVSDWFLHTEIRGAAAPQRGGLSERLGSHSPHVVAAVAAMESHVADPLTLPQLALVVGVTPRHLTRLFNDVLGQGVMAFYRALRLDVAKRMVQQSPMPLTEIAAATGFANAAHFSNAYKDLYGVRPRADRRAVAPKEREWG